MRAPGAEVARAGARRAPQRSPHPLRVVAWPARAVENPYIDQLYENLEEAGVEVIPFSVPALLRGRPAVWHLHWPDEQVSFPGLARSVVRGAAVIALMTAARARGTRVVWTVHNLQSHERFHPRLERWFWRAFVRRLDGYITLAAGTGEAARERFPRLREIPGFVVPHGHYRDAYPREVTREEARDRLEIPRDARVAGFVGQIRAYKNVPRLIRTFREVAGAGDLLLVAGAPDEPRMEREVLAAAGDDPRVRLCLRFVPDQDLQLYLGAMDVVVLPYREILNSGSALLALSFDVPVLVPGRGAMTELREHAGEEWVRSYTGELSARVLREALEWAGRRRPRCVGLDRLSWSRLAADTLSAYRALLSPARPAGPSSGS